MAELLVKAISASLPDPDQDRRGCYKIGMPVVVMPDGHRWGEKERPPLFYILKVPGISVDKALKFIDPEYEALPDEHGAPIVCRCRKWQIRIADLPQAAKDNFSTNGELIIKTPAYEGVYDYTWDQVKIYFRNLETSTDGAELD